MKKVLTASLVIIFVSTLVIGFQQGASWQRFNSPEGKFNILMPSEPKLLVKDIDVTGGTLTLNVFEVTTSNAYFSISYVDYPVAPTDPNEADLALDGVRDSIRDGSNSEIVSEKKISLYNYPGRELISKKTNKGDVFIFNWRVCLVGRRLYQLAVGTSQKDSEMPDITKFLISFDLNKSATR